MSVVIRQFESIFIKVYVSIQIITLLDDLPT